MFMSFQLVFTGFFTVLLFIFFFSSFRLPFSFTSSVASPACKKELIGCPIINLPVV